MIPGEILLEDRERTGVHADSARARIETFELPQAFRAGGAGSCL